MEIKVTDENFKQEVLESSIPVLVDFWAEWCMPCKLIMPALQEIAEEYQGRLKVYKLNVDEGPQTSSEYGIMSIPTVAIFKEGKLVDKIIGAVSKTEIISKIEPHI